MAGDVRRPHNCVICGVPFIPVRGQKACSKKHRYQWKLREMARRKRDKRRTTIRLCAVCRCAIPSTRHGLSNVCSDVCQTSRRNLVARLRYESDPSKRERSKRYRQRHAERYREHSRRHYKRRDRKRVNAWFREWYANNADKRSKRLAYGKQWRVANRDLMASYTNRWRSRRKGAEGSHTLAEARELLARQKYRCAFCRTDLRKTKKTRDHIIALTKGGTDSITNIQWLCGPCNSRKNNKDPIDFARENGLLL